MGRCRPRRQVRSVTALPVHSNQLSILRPVPSSLLRLELSPSQQNPRARGTGEGLHWAHWALCHGGTAFPRDP